MSGDPGYFLKSSKDPLFESKVDQCLLGDILRFRNISVQAGKDNIYVRITKSTTSENSTELAPEIFREANTFFKEICESSPKFKLAVNDKKSRSSGSY